MPIPESEGKVWPAVFAEQFLSTPPPYFGTNIFDVLTVNWEAVLKKSAFSTRGGQRGRGPVASLCRTRRWSAKARDLDQLLSQRNTSRQRDDTDFWWGHVEVDGVLQFDRELPMVLHDGATVSGALSSCAGALAHGSAVGSIRWNWMLPMRLVSSW